MAQTITRDITLFKILQKNANAGLLYSTIVERVPDSDLPPEDDYCITETCMGQIIQFRYLHDLNKFTDPYRQ